MEIIILIIIIAVVLGNNKKKRVQSKSNSYDYGHGTGSTGNYNGQNKGTQNTASRSVTGTSTTYRSTGRSVSNQSVVGKNLTTQSGVTGIEKSKKSSGGSNELKSEKSSTAFKKNSTLEYLDKKAAQDEAEHLEEERRAAIKHQQMYGNAKIGESYVDGDAIPGGMVKVKCSYCAADNLVKLRERGNCLCYFCRTKL